MEAAAAARPVPPPLRDPMREGGPVKTPVFSLSVGVVCPELARRKSRVGVEVSRRFKPGREQGGKWWGTNGNAQQRLTKISTKASNKGIRNVPTASSESSDLLLPLSDRDEPPPNLKKPNRLSLIIDTLTLT